MRLLLAEQPLTEAKVRFVWTLVAGPAVARASTVTFSEGTLTVRAKSESWRQEVQRARPAMMVRLGQFLGPGVVRAMSVTSDDAPSHLLHHRL